MKENGHNENHEIGCLARLSMLEQHLTCLEVKLKRVFGHKYETFHEHEARLLECSDGDENPFDGAAKVERRLTWVEIQLERVFGGSYEALAARILIANLQC